MDRLSLIPVPDLRVPALWKRLMSGMDNPALAFGPEHADPRPRAGDTYYLALNGDVEVGLCYFQRPSKTTAVYALGLYREFQSSGYGLALRDAAIDICLSDPDVHKVEAEVYSGNVATRTRLMERHKRLNIEGVQCATIKVDGEFYDRILLGATRQELAANRH